MNATRANWLLACRQFRDNRLDLVVSSDICKTNRTKNLTVNTDTHEERKETTFVGALATNVANNLHYYLEHDVERETIAAAGQRRTLGDHTYTVRMPELLDVLVRGP